MREQLKSFNGLITNVATDKLKKEYSPACSDVKFTPTHQLLSRKGFDKINTVSFGAPITLIDQIENDGTWYGTYIMGSNMYGFLKGVDVSPIPAGYTGIYDVDDLQAMQDDLSASYILMNNIDASDTINWNGGLGFEPIGDSTNSFRGIFDSNRYKGTGLYINRPSTNYVGLFGHATDAEIKNVGLIDVNITGQNQVTGLIGYGFNCIITNCYSTGIVVGQGYYTAGLIAINTGTITNCYSRCSVNGDIHAAGLVALNDGTITNSYSTGAVSGNSGFIGGLIGDNTGGVCIDGFWDTETSGQASSNGGTGKTTEEMKQEATFTNWDFSTIWAIVENVSYPTLR